MKKNLKIICLITAFITMNKAIIVTSFASDSEQLSDKNKKDLTDAELYVEADKFVQERNLKKDFDAMRSPVLAGKFDNVDPTIKKDYLISYEFLVEAEALERKAKLSYEIAEEFNKKGMQQATKQHDSSSDFNKKSDFEVNKETKKTAPKNHEELELIFRKIVLSGKFDAFDPTIKKFLMASDKELNEARINDKMAQALRLESKKSEAKGLKKILMLPSDTFDRNPNQAEK